MNKNTVTISILLPTRGRTTMLKNSLESLLKTASNTQRLEFILGLDDDDTVTMEYVKSEITTLMAPYQVESRAQVFKPLGYENLHVYVNTLASTATGQWMFFWNDDAIMQTQGWDDVIASHTGEFKLLGPRDNHNGHPYAIFPIVPRDWFILMDHLSQNAQNDAWLSHIAYMLDIFERIPVDVIHDRADLTGNNNDETFQNRKYQEGNPSDPRDFGHANQQQARVASAYKIAWYLEKIGQPSNWWREVTAGKRNPFEKMVWSPEVKGAGQLAAVKSDKTESPALAPQSKTKLPDDAKILL